MPELHGNQKKILEFLGTQPNGATLDELAAHLEVSRSAVKEHVLKVQALGAITYKDVPGFIGRPRRHYLLTTEGHEVFPRQYAWLSSVLLEHLSEEFDEAQVIAMMRALADRVSQSMAAKFQAASSSADKLSLLTTMMNELGYQATLKQSDLRKGAIIEATNCVYHAVAKSHPELCNFDIKLVENAIEVANVKLESCIARGGTVCRFCIRKD